MKHLINLFLLSICFFLFSCDNAPTEEEFLKPYDLAFAYYLNQKQVVKHLPDKLECGENAPFYQIDKDGYVFMQVVENNGPMAFNGRSFAKRYASYNLLEYYKTKVWPKPFATSNTSSLTPLPTSKFDVNSIQYLHLALHYVGVESTVNFVVRQDFNRSDIPYYIEVRYSSAD